MCKSNICVLLMCIIILGSIQPKVFASGKNRAGTCAGTQLLIPVGARDLAMSGSTVANTSGIEALYWNPAGVARTSSNSDVIISHMNYFADIGQTYFAVSGNFSGLGSIAFSLKTFSFGDIPITTEKAPDGTGGTFSPTFFTTGLTYSRGLTDRIFIGITTNLISEQIERVSATAVAFNIGVQYYNFLNVPGVSFGVVIKDFGTRMKYDGPALLRQGNIPELQRPSSYYKLDAASFDLPSTIEIGLAYDLTIGKSNKLQFASAFLNSNYSNDEYRLGAEYSIGKLIFLRGGYTFADNDPENNYVFGFTAGCGLRFNFTGLDIQMDFAYRDANILSSNYIYAVKFGF